MHVSDKLLHWTEFSTGRTVGFYHGTLQGMSILFSRYKMKVLNVTLKSKKGTFITKQSNMLTNPIICIHIFDAVTSNYLVIKLVFLTALTEPHWYIFRWFRNSKVKWSNCAFDDWSKILHKEWLKIAICKNVKTFIKRLNYHGLI